MEICEFYVDDENKPRVNTIFQKTLDGNFTLNNPTKYLKNYLAIQGVILDDDLFHLNNNNVNNETIEAL